MKKQIQLLLILCIGIVLYSCKPEKNEEPTVVTLTPTEITATTAKCSGEVTSEGSSTITSRGICWATTEEPTINDNHKKSDGGVGGFEITLTDLEPETMYYVRAYATNEVGTAYGESKSFSTIANGDGGDDNGGDDNGGNDDEIILATVTTNNVTEITTNSAVSGGNITSNGNGTITARGVCYSTSQNPTIENAHTEDGTEAGNFTSNLTNLEANTTYYVRAYATNEKGTAYGEEKSFTTEAETVIELPTVTTTDITDITTNSARSGGNVTSDGNSTITARGVCYSTNQNPTIDGSHTTNGTGTGGFMSNLTDLEANTTYYVRAYATNEQGTAYGEEKSFTTEAGNDESDYNGYEYVDLGLPSGLKWASYNIGADTPEEYGDYFAWGEISPKAEYIGENCITWDIDMEDISGDVDYDAATANWGGAWRMPLRSEMQELKDNCTWEWSSQNGVAGYKVTGPNGNHIFLPAAGGRDGVSPVGAGTFGLYWGSTPHENRLNAYSFWFSEGSVEVSYNFYRTYGFTVRAVAE